jgi:hypothetical protein
MTKRGLYPSTVRLYLRSLWALQAPRRLLRRLPQVYYLLEACFSGFWLGILQREELHRIDQAYYDDPANLYNEDHDYFDAEYNRRGLWKWERQAIDTCFPKDGKLLVGSAGGGREVLALCRRGYEVEGYECHPLLQRDANALLAQEGFPPSVRLVDRDECPQYEQMFDGAVVGWGSYMHIQGRRRRVAYLRAVRSQLLNGAPILVSFVGQEGLGRRLKIITAVSRGVRWFLRREPLEAGDALGPGYEHYFTEDEIRGELAEAGFEMRFFSQVGYGHAVATTRPQTQPALE